jgi:hypothetical protein
VFHLDDDLCKNVFTDSAFILVIVHCILVFNILIFKQKLCLGIKITPFFMYLRKLNNPGNGFFFCIYQKPRIRILTIQLKVCNKIMFTCQSDFRTLCIKPNGMTLDHCEKSFTIIHLIYKTDCKIGMALTPDLYRSPFPFWSAHCFECVCWGRKFDARKTNSLWRNMSGTHGDLWNSNSVTMFEVSYHLTAS